MNSKINNLLQFKDNAEKIRDIIAGILKIELANQKTLADKSDLKDRKDFDINVYIENARPWDLSGSETNPFPLVNVCLQETLEDANRPGATVGKIKYSGTYYIDCYGCGNYQSADEDKNELSDDSLSTIRAWQTARIVRNILMSGFYVHLGMTGIVTRRRIPKITTIIPEGIEKSAFSVTVCRVYFEVDFFEISPEGDGVAFDEMTVHLMNDGKVNLITLSADYTKEEGKE